MAIAFIDSSNQTNLNQHNYVQNKRKPKMLFDVLLSNTRVFQKPTKWFYQMQLIHIYNLLIIAHSHSH